jgi:anti-anti-sigma factor
VTVPFRAERAERCSVRRDGAVLHLAGEIDADNWLEVGERIAAAVRIGIVRLDLSRMTFFGAAGVRAVLHGREALPAGRTLHLTCAPMVFRVLEICEVGEADGLIVTRAAREPHPLPQARPPTVPGARSMDR